MSLIFEGFANRLVFFYFFTKGEWLYTITNKYILYILQNNHNFFYLIDFFDKKKSQNK